ncbi:lysozyme C-1-like [Meriones unguiculatus]|uniref:lysozyme C-1-like n=1 Tax=Meriones unguiculatus TaxID=10047 RepID=UPI00293EB14E|nr:lysozyme C-1-like [Meriones unguiculatus]
MPTDVRIKRLIQGATIGGWSSLVSQQLLQLPGQHEGSPTLALLLLSATVQAKVYERCELAKILKSKGMHGHAGFRLADWLCLVHHESGYNTQAITHHHRVADYGIFQIKSRLWCDDGKNKNPRNGCGIPCSALLQDDITQAIECVKTVARHGESLLAWMSWRKNCKEKDLPQYVQDCGV